MNKVRLTSLVLLTVLSAGCKRDAQTGLPVWDDKSSSGPGIPTVPPQVAGPTTSDYPKSPPLSALNPQTGKQDSWLGGDPVKSPPPDAQVLPTMPQERQAP